MSFKYLLDTNICIYIMKEQPPVVRKKFEQLDLGTMGMSVITYGELLYGAQKSKQSNKAKDLIHQLCDYIPPLPLSLKVSKYYAIIRAGLEKQGRMIGNNDLWIAAHCLDLDLILVTNNEREFSQVDKLKVENWV